jgi:hypothetical protein
MFHVIKRRSVPLPELILSTPSPRLNPASHLNRSKSSQRSHQPRQSNYSAMTVSFLPTWSTILHRSTTHPSASPPPLRQRVATETATRFSTAGESLPTPTRSHPTASLLALEPPSSPSDTEDERVHNRRINRRMHQLSKGVVRPAFPQRGRLPPTSVSDRCDACPSFYSLTPAGRAWFAYHSSSTAGRRASKRSHRRLRHGLEASSSPVNRCVFCVFFFRS